MQLLFIQNISYTLYKKYNKKKVARSFVNSSYIYVLAPKLAFSAAVLTSFEPQSDNGYTL